MRLHGHLYSEVIMQTRFVMTDGAKSVGMLSSNDPSIWNFFSGAPQSSKVVLYSYVAAVYRAYNLFADTVGSLPFALYSLNGKDEYDSSENWENKVGFLPNPSELWRLDTLSYIDSNTVYNLRTSDVIGYKTKGLYFAVPTTFYPVTNASGQLDYIERRVNGSPERYETDDKRLVRMWRKDHTTEVLPSPNTIAQAIQHSAEQVLYTDSWITHYYQRGGIKPTLIAMKGLVQKEKGEEAEKTFTQWLRGLGKYFGNIAKIYNAETMDIKAFGDGVAELKDNGVYRQALENIAIGAGLPLSLLLSNSANYATASTEERQWYKNTITPFSRWLAYGYNEQVFHPMGLHLKYNMATMDSQQEEDAQNAATAKVINDLLLQCPTYELFEAISKSYVEVSDELLVAAKQYYTDKAKQAAPVVVNTQPDTAQPKPGTETEEIPVGTEKNDTKAIGENDTSAMIALRIPDVIRAEIKEKYPFVDSETLSDLHITLAHLGDNRTIDKLDVVRAVSEMGKYQFPIKGKLQGLARFANGRDVDPLVMTFDSPQMPGVYSVLCSFLDSYHIPYHKEHGFIPHMTLAYIPKDAEMPIDSIEPIEINFSDIYYVDSNVWYSVQLVGYENKNTKWTPSLDELDELRIWREVALRRHKKGESLDFEYQPHHGGLPESVTADIKARLIDAVDNDTIKAVFVVNQSVVKDKPKPDTDIKSLANAINKYADVLNKTKQLTATT